MALGKILLGSGLILCSFLAEPKLLKATFGGLAIYTLARGEKDTHQGMIDGIISSSMEEQEIELIEAEKAIQIETLYFEKMPQMAMANNTPANNNTALSPETLADLKTVTLKSVLDRGIGIFLMAPSGYGKSSLVKWFCGELNHIESLTVCDPHWDGEQDYGVVPYYKYDDILDQLENALNELDSRRELKRVGKKFNQKIYVFDEWPSIRIYAEDDKEKKKLCKNALVRLGSECRKYNMLVFFCSQSGSVKANGLDGQGDFLSNFALIRLGELAVNYAKDNGLKNEYQLIKNVAYPCLVNKNISYHETHGNYTEFKDKQPPINIKEFTVGNQPKLTKTSNTETQNNENEIIDVEDVEESESETETKTELKPESTGNNIVTRPDFKIDLNKPSKNTKTLADLEAEILDFCKSNETTTTREIQNKFKNDGIKAKTIKTILYNFESQGLGSISIKKVGGAESVSFTYNSDSQDTAGVD